MFYRDPRLVADQFEPNFHMGELARSEALLPPTEGKSDAGLLCGDLINLEDLVCWRGFDETSVWTRREDKGARWISGEAE